LGVPRKDEARIVAAPIAVARSFGDNVRGMATALADKRETDRLLINAPRLGDSTIMLADTSTMALEDESVDLALTSPPYCTRIDYTAATRIELAVLGPLLSTSARALGKQM